MAGTSPAMTLLEVRPKPLHLARPAISLRGRSPQTRPFTGNFHGQVASDPGPASRPCRLRDGAELDAAHDVRAERCRPGHMPDLWRHPRLWLQGAGRGFQHPRDKIA